MIILSCYLYNELKLEYTILSLRNVRICVNAHICTFIEIERILATNNLFHGFLNIHICIAKSTCCVILSSKFLPEKSTLYYLNRSTADKRSGGNRMCVRPSGK